jgi:hypothetical protein
MEVGVERSERELPEAQFRAIEALVGGATMVAAAEQAGVARATLFRWQHDPRFVAALNQALRDHRAEVRGEIRALAQSAIKALRDVLEATDRVTPFLKVKIAQQILRSIGADEAEPIGPVRPEVLEALWQRMPILPPPEPR